MPTQKKDAGQATPVPPFYGRRLVFFGVAEDQNEPALLQLFSQHGNVSGLFIVRSALGLSSGCGYVTMASAEQAKAAMGDLVGSTKCAEAGSVLGLLLIETTSGSAGEGTADDLPDAAGSRSPTTDNSTNSQQGPLEPKTSRTVFFTKVPPTVTTEQLIQLFSSCGKVQDLELFTPWPGAKISKGCGLVEFATSTAAAAAVHSLHQKFTWPHSHSALVVEWMDSRRQANSGKGAKARTAAAAAGSSSGPLSGVSAASPAAGTSQRLPVLHHQHHHHLSACQPLGSSSPQQLPIGTSVGVMQPQMFHQYISQPHLRMGPTGRGSSHSCPLPQLPPGWQVVGTTCQLPPGSQPLQGVTQTQWTSVPSGLAGMTGTGSPAANFVYVQVPQQQSPGQADHSTLAAQQQQQQLLQYQAGNHSCDGSSGLWVALPATAALSNSSAAASLDQGHSSGYSSMSSTMDSMSVSTNSSSCNPGSTANSAYLGGLAGSWDQPQQQAAVVMSSCDLSAGMGNSTATAAGSSGLGQMMPVMPVAGTNVSDAVLQQLLQENVMLLQTLSLPAEEEAAVVQQRVLMPTSAPGLTADSMQQGLQMPFGASTAPTTATVGGIPGFRPPPRAQQQVQVVYSSAMLAPSQPQQQPSFQQSQAPQPQQQAYWMQPQQPAGEALTMALPLASHQLPAMQAVLPEISKLGVAAWVGPAGAGGVHLVLQGSYAMLTSAHSAVTSLMATVGVNDPLVPTAVRAGAAK